MADERQEQGAEVGRLAQPRRVYQDLDRDMPDLDLRRGDRVIYERGVPGHGALVVMQHRQGGQARPILGLARRSRRGRTWVYGLRADGTTGGRFALDPKGVYFVAKTMERRLDANILPHG